MKGWHSSDGWSPAFVFGEIPEDVTFADDAGEMPPRVWSDGDGQRDVVDVGSGCVMLLTWALVV